MTLTNMVCAYCLVKNSVLDDVRKLKCGHIGCLQCLTEASRTSRDMECPTCNVTFTITDVNSLEKVTIEPKSSATNNGGMCDVCDEKVADVFCVTCQMLLCKAHKKDDQVKAEAHQEHAHYHVKVKQYYKNKGMYAMYFCKEHQNRQTSQACNRCLQQFCTACVIQEKCPATGDMHELSSLSTAAETIRNRLADLQAALAEKITRFASLEKATARKLEFINKEKEKLISEIDKTVKEQVEAITLEGEMVKADICKYVERFNRQAESLMMSFINGNIKAEELIQDLVKISTITAEGAVLHHFSRAQGEIESMLNTDYESIRVPAKHLVNIGEFRKLEVKLEELTVGSLEYMNSAFDFEYCYSVRHISENLLVTATSDHIELRDRSLNLLTSVETKAMCFDVVPFGGQLFVLLYRMSKKIKLYSQNLDFIREIVDLPKEGGIWSQIAVCDGILVASDPIHKCVYVYSWAGDLLHTISHHSMDDPRGLCITTDGCLLVADWSDKGSVMKFLLGGDYSLVWTSDPLVYPWGIQEVHEGCIYVTRNKSGDGAIYQLSSEGLHFLKEITCDQLRKVSDGMGISVAGNLVFVACLDKGIQRFQLNCAQ